MQRHPVGPRDEQAVVVGRDARVGRRRRAARRPGPARPRTVRGIDVWSTGTVRPSGAGTWRRPPRRRLRGRASGARRPASRRATPTSSAAVPAAIAQRNRRTDAASDAAIHSETATRSIRSACARAPGCGAFARRRPAVALAVASSAALAPQGLELGECRRHAPRRSPPPRRRSAAVAASARRARVRPMRPPSVRPAGEPGRATGCRTRAPWATALTLALRPRRSTSRTNIADAPGTSRKIAQRRPELRRRRFTLRVASRRRRNPNVVVEARKSDLVRRHCQQC